jgi:uncharacterized repeat protein (TIGR01451 family)/fimbrial isopeptide formation D2 family protein
MSRFISARTRAHLLTQAIVTALVSGMLAVTAVLLAAAPAQAAGSPDLQLSGGPAASVLYGDPVPVALTASLPAGAPKGYNLAYRFALPVGTSYVAGSAGEEAGEPTVIADAPTAGRTTLIWPNAYDLVANASHTLAFELAYRDTGDAAPRYDVGDPIAVDMGAYLSTDPRDEADFSALGLPQTGVDSYTGWAEKSTTTQLTAIEIEKSEPHPEGEIPRGVHDHHTVYTLTLTNNSVNPTAGVTVDDYLPAGLEFLGCAGTPDHSATEEYAGSGAIVVAQPTSDCVDPVLVETVDTDPDGAGPLESGVHTHVRWTHPGTFAPGQVQRIRYAAAVPIRENTVTWPATTPATTGAQAANLDNNTGPETYDEQPLLNGAIAAGTYQSPVSGARPVSDEGTLLRTAEDLAIQKSNDNGGLEQGELTKWTVDLQVSEYRYVDHVVVRDTVPNGLCPLGTINHSTGNDASDAECAPTAGKLPNHAYTAVTEQSDGTFAVVWDESTWPALAHLAPSDTRQLTFWTRTRTSYQSGFADSTPVLSRDAVTNDIATEGLDWVRCAPADPSCTGTGTKIWHTETDGELDLDVSQSGKAATGPAILKQVAATYPASGDCHDLAAADYGKTVPAYGPGDLVCWKLRLTFPSHLDTFSQDVFDVLPRSLTYVPGSWHETVNNTLEIGAFDDTADDTVGRLSWEIGGGGSDVDAGGEVFEVTLKTTVGAPSGHHSGDVDGNLQKFSFQNTAGKAFTLRDRVDFALSLPELGVTKTADDEEVEAGQGVHYTVGVVNTGTAPAQDARVRDELPTHLTCAEVSSISDGGTCTAGRITWTGVDVAAAATRNLTYTLTVPADVSPGVTYTNRVGVVEYGYTTNAGTTYQLVPDNPVVTDAGLIPNMPAAEATESIRTRDAAVAKTRSTSVTEAGNSAAQATVGETVTYTVTTTIPRNTTVYGARVTDPLGARQTLVPGSLCVTGCTLDGAAFGGVTESPANTVLATLPATYAAPSGADGKLVLTFQAKVLDVAANTRGQSLGNTATLIYTDQDGVARTRTGSVTTTIAEPRVGVAKAVTGATIVGAGDVRSFTVTASNGTGSNVSTAHDVVVVDTLPAGTEPVTIDQGGVWNDTARTITWNKTTTPALGAIAPGGSLPLTYTVQVESPPVGGTTYTNTVLATSTSLASTVGGVRSPASSATTASDYDATADKVLQVRLPGITKTVDPADATVGSNVTWTVGVTVPAGIRYFDTTVVDTVPDGLAVDAYGAITCTAGCPGTDPAVTAFPVTTSGTTQQAAWFLGDLAPAAQQRTYTLVLHGHVLATKRAGDAVAGGASYVNQARVRTNRTDVLGAAPAGVAASYSDTAGPASATTTVHEPRLAIDKAADRGPYVEGGDLVTYTVTVRNTGDWPAYDVAVTDQPDTELVDVTLVDGAGLSTDGWTAADPDLRWSIPGPLAAGATRTFTYTATVKPGAQLAAGDQIANTARIPSYFGASTAERTGDADNPWRAYVGPQKTVTLTVAKPELTIVKTPDQGAATAGENTTFTLKVTNTDTRASAHGVVVRDVLPAGLTYVSSTPSGTASGQQVDWTVGTLAPGASVTITVVARVGSGVATGTTLTNTASTHADEVPTDTTDTGSVVVGTKTDLKVTKTASAASALAGEDLAYTITTTNVGPSDALEATMADTLPAYLHPVSVDDPAHCAVAGQAITCDYGTLAPGATRTVQVTVQVDPARTAPAVNTATVSTTTPDTVPANDTSTVTTPVVPRADVSVTKTADGVDYEGGDTVTYTLVARNDGPSTAQGVTLSDPLPSDLSFVSVAPGASCSQAGGTVSCALGALAPGESRTVTVVATAQGTPPVPDSDGHDHQVDVTKTEQYVSLQPGETRTQDLDCTDGGTMTDGAVEVMSVDQGAGSKADVVVRQARSTGLSTYRFVVGNTTTGQAQVKLFGTCLPARTTTVDGHAHDLVVGSLQTLGTGALAVGRHTFTIPVAAGTRGVAPGIEVLSGRARLVGARPVATGWELTVDVVAPGSSTLSLRAMQTRTAMAGSPSHLHGLDTQHVTRTVTLAPGESVQRVGCPTGYKGITASYLLPPGVTLLGHEPQPVNRDFRLLNTTGGDLDVELGLECLAVRTGTALDDVVTVVNTATVATTTYDPDPANDTSSATVTVARAAGSVSPAPSGPGLAAPAGPASGLRHLDVGDGGRKAVVQVVCTGTSGTCQGTVTLTALVPRKFARATRVVLGTARYTVVAGDAERVHVTIRKRFRALVRQDRLRGFRIV